MVCKRLGDYWQYYRIKDVLEMLRVITEIHISTGSEFTRHFMPVISSWIKHHIHTLSEDQLLAILYCYSKMGYVDADFVVVLSKYVKIRGVQIKDANLVAAICDYSADMRLRNKAVLNGVSEYFVSHSKQLTTPQLFAVAKVSL